MVRIEDKLSERQSQPLARKNPCTAAGMRGNYDITRIRSDE